MSAHFAYLSIPIQVALDCPQVSHTILLAMEAHLMDAYMNPKCTNPNTVIEQSICLCIVSECHFGVVSRFDCMYIHSEWRHLT